jgi:hypothetical protein
MDTFYPDKQQPIASQLGQTYSSQFTGLKQLEEEGRLLTRRNNKIIKSEASFGETQSKFKNAPNPLLLPKVSPDS